MQNAHYQWRWWWWWHNRIIVKISTRWKELRFLRKESLKPLNWLLGITCPSSAYLGSWHLDNAVVCSELTHHGQWVEKVSAQTNRFKYLYVLLWWTCISSSNQLYLKPHGQKKHRLKLIELTVSSLQKTWHKGLAVIFHFGLISARMCNLLLLLLVT